MNARHAQAIRRFLGLSHDADDRSLLDVSASPTPEQLRAALAERLVRIDRHPDRQSADAAYVRALLREAAERLLRAGDRASERGAPSGAGQGARSSSVVPSRSMTSERKNIAAPERSSASSGPMSSAGATTSPGPMSATGATSASAPTSSSSDAPPTPTPPQGHPLARAGGRAPRAGEAPAPSRPPFAPRRPQASAAGPGSATAASRGSFAVASGPPRPLTAFDRMVLATLVAGGGWNAMSRDRLVALAAARGVSVDGLLKVVSGLAHHVRGGGTRPGLRDMTEGAALMLAERNAGPPSRLEAMVEHITQAMGDELRSERIAPRLRITAIFAIVTLAMLALLVRIMLSDPSSPTTSAPHNDSAALAPSQPLAPGAPGEAGSEGAAAPIGAAPSVQLAKYPRPPNFSGDARPTAALRLSERAASLPALIDTLGRRIVRGGAQPSVAIDREWLAAVDEAGGCWPLLERSLRRKVAAAFADSLRGVDGPALGDRLVGSLVPDPTPDDGAALWRSAMRVGLLGEIVADGAVLPPAVVQRAGELLQQSLVEPVPGGVRGFDEAAGRWLDRAVAPLVAMLAAPSEGSSERFADPWEAWIVAQRAVRDGAALQRAYAGAAGAVLRSGIDLGAAGPASDVLGRFVQMLEFNDVPAVRTAVLSWFDDPRISTNALWVLTSLMVHKGDIRWIGSDLVLDWSASPEGRTASARAIAARWPEPVVAKVDARPAFVVANDALEKWLAALRRLEAQAAASRDAATSVRTLLLAAMLNDAAAAHEAGQDQHGREVVARIEGALSPDGDRWPRRGALTKPPRGTAGAGDGEFADAMEQAERNTEQRLGLLRQLRLRGDGDLGVRDAEALVRTASRGSPAEVRSVARGVLAEAFGHGPNVVLELLDQLSESGPSEEMAQVISQITDTTLPPARHAEWLLAARLALLRHALLLRDDADVDADSELLAETMRSRLETASRGPSTALASGTPPQQVLARLVDAWRLRAAATIAARPTPAPLPELDRRRALRERLAQGAITSFVAGQVAHAELTAYVIAAQAPWLEAACRDVLDSSAADRAAAQTATSQAVATELALAHLWEIAMVGDPTIGSASRGSTLPDDENGGRTAGGADGGAHNGASRSGSGAGGSNPAPPGGAGTSPSGGNDDRRKPPRAPVAPPGAEQPTRIPPPPRGAAGAGGTGGAGGSGGHGGSGAPGTPGGSGGGKKK